MRDSGHRRWRLRLWRAGVLPIRIFTLLGAILIAVTLLLAGRASANDIPVDPPTGPPPTMLPTPEIMDPTTGEAAALYQFAQELGWDTTVWRDYSGRLYVEEVVTQTEWIRAIIRPFEFETGAQAAFLAEQEDALLAGYSVSPTTLASFPAFWATYQDDQGRIVQRRLHWIAERWILGIDTAGLTFNAEGVEILARNLVRVAEYNGLPSPSEPTPSVTPTRSRATPTQVPTQAPPEMSPTSEPATPTEDASPTPTPCATFSDVPPDYWAYEYVGRMACMGVVTGYSDGTFRPQTNVTRGQLVKMIVTAQGIALINPITPTFSDVSRGHSFYRYIETANLRRIVTGYSDKTFRPDLPVSRAQIAKIVVRAKRWAVLRPIVAPACDVPRGHWAADYIYTAMFRGVLTGYSDGCFHPDAPATRAQVAKVLSASTR